MDKIDYFYCLIILTILAARLYTIHVINLPQSRKNLLTNSYNWSSQFLNMLIRSVPYTYYAEILCLAIASRLALNCVLVHDTCHVLLLIDPQMTRLFGIRVRSASGMRYSKCVVNLARTSTVCDINDVVAHTMVTWITNLIDFHRDIISFQQFSSAEIKYF